MKMTVSFFMATLFIVGCSTSEISKRNPSSESSSESSKIPSAARLFKVSSLAKAFYRKEVVKLSRCIEKSIKKTRNAEESITNAIGYTNDLEKFLESGSLKGISSVSKKCKSSLKKLGMLHQTRETVRNQLMELFLKKDLVSNESYAFLRSLIRPMISCGKAQVDVSIAVLVGVGADLKISSCRSTTGRRWLEVGAGAGVGIGGGLSISGFGERKYRFGRSPLKLLDFSYSKMKTGGYGGTYTEYNKEFLHLDEKFLKEYAKYFNLSEGEDDFYLEEKPEVTEANGVGLGAMGMIKLNADLKVLPLPRDKKFLDNLFLNFTK